MKAAITAMLCALMIFITLPAKAAGSCGSGAEMLTVDEILLMAKVMELENGCNSDLCLMLTGSVILNRRSSPEWPADWTLRHIPTVKVSGRGMALALKLATGGTMDAEIIFQSMHPELGKVKYHVDTEYFATKK